MVIRVTGPQETRAHRSPHGVALGRKVGRAVLAVGGEPGLVGLGLEPAARVVALPEDHSAIPNRAAMAWRTLPIWGTSKSRGMSA